MKKNLSKINLKTDKIVSLSKNDMQFVKAGEKKRNMSAGCADVTVKTYC